MKQEKCLDIIYEYKEENKKMKMKTLVNVKKRPEENRRVIKT